MKKLWMVGALVVAFAGGFMLRGVVPGEPVAYAQAQGRVFELRTYTAVDAEKLAALARAVQESHAPAVREARDAEHRLLEAVDAPLSANTMIYVIAHKSREAAKQSWTAFRNDPEWTKVSTESEANGRILAKAPESVYLEATDYSPMK